MSDTDDSWKLRDDADKIVAIVYNDDGSVHDYCYSWETGQCFALHEGKIVKAVRDDGDYSTIEWAQSLYNSERAAYRDCFGIEAQP